MCGIYLCINTSELSVTAYSHHSCARDPELDRAKAQILGAYQQEEDQLHQIPSEMLLARLIECANGGLPFMDAKQELEHVCGMISSLSTGSLNDRYVSLHSKSEHLLLIYCSFDLLAEQR